MHQIKGSFGFTLLLAALLLACHASQSPVLNLQNVALTSGSGRALTQKEVGEVIKKSLQQRGWSIQSSKSGHIDAAVQSGGHSAEIAIDYGPGRYSITHKSSSPGLRYEAGREIIHKRYNLWVDRLRVAIHANVPAT